MQTDDDFGAQGGDPRRMIGDVHIDLSTCVNFYGPPPAVLDALRTASARPTCRSTPTPRPSGWRPSTRATSASARQLVAGRGTTEFIWALSRQVPHARRRAAARLHRLPQGVPRPRLRRRPDPVDRARRCGARRRLARDRLQPAQPDRCRARPRRARRGRPPPSARDVRRRRVLRRLRARSARATVVGADADNLVVLRSPSKFWGIAATRVGVAWCPIASACAACSAGARPGRSRASTSLSPRRRWRRRLGERVASRSAQDAAWLAERCASCRARSSRTTSACTIAASSPSTADEFAACFARTASACACSGAHTARSRGCCGSSRRCRGSARRSPRRARVVEAVRGAARAAAGA